MVIIPKTECYRNRPLCVKYDHKVDHLITKSHCQTDGPNLHCNKAEATNGTESTSEKIWVQYVTRDACPFSKEEIEYALDTIDDSLRNFAAMLDTFYKAKIDRYTGKEEYDFTTEEIV